MLLSHSTWVLVYYIILFLQIFKFFIKFWANYEDHKMNASYFCHVQFYLLNNNLVIYKFNISSLIFCPSTGIDLQSLAYKFIYYKLKHNYGASKILNFSY